MKVFVSNEVHLLKENDKHKSCLQEEYENGLLKALGFLNNGKLILFEVRAKGQTVIVLAKLQVLYWLFLDDFLLHLFIFLLIFL